MRMYFKCQTNGKDCMINTVKFKLATGSVLTIDRYRTEWSIDNGIMDMTWFNCYLWAIDDCHIFGNDDALLCDENNLRDLLKGATAEFELEDDAFNDCPDYYVKILEWSV